MNWQEHRLTQDNATTKAVERDILKAAVVKERGKRYSFGKEQIRKGIRNLVEPRINGSQ
jgi:hypothetical protein